MLHSKVIHEVVARDGPEIGPFGLPTELVHALVETHEHVLRKVASNIVRHTLADEKLAHPPEIRAVQTFKFVRAFHQSPIPFAPNARDLGNQRLPVIVDRPRHISRISTSIVLTDRNGRLSAYLGPLMIRLMSGPLCFGTPPFLPLSVYGWKRYASPSKPSLSECDRKHDAQNGEENAKPHDPAAPDFAAGPLPPEQDVLLIGRTGI